MKKYLFGIKNYFCRHPEIFLFFVIGFLVYANSLANRFVWDDLSLIVNNQFIKSPDFFREVFLGKIYDTGSVLDGQEIFYRPLVLFVFGVFYRIFGLHPEGFHFFQIVLHIVNAFFVYNIFCLVFSKSYRDAKRLSLAADLLFLVHPINTESVSYIASFQEVISTFFVLSTLLLLLKTNGSKVWGFPQILFFSLVILLALLSKESGIIIIPLGLILLYVLRRRILIKFSLSSLLSVFVYLFLRYRVAHISNGFTGPFPMMQASLLARIQTIPSEMTYYLDKFIFPLNLTIARHWVVDEITFTNFVIPAFILLSGFVLVGYCLKKYHSKIFFFFCLWFLLPMILIINLVPLDMTVANRWFYFPQIGLLGMFVFIWQKFSATHKVMSRIFIPVFLSILVIFGIRTILRNFDWTNNYVLYASDLKKDPENFYLENNLGATLYERNDKTGAESHLLNSVGLYQSWFPPFKNLGHLYFYQKDYEKAEKYYQKAIRLGSYDATVYTNYAKLLSLKKEYGLGYNLLVNYLNYFPDNRDFFITLVFLSNKLGLKDKENFYLKRLLKTNNNPPVFVTP